MKDQINVDEVIEMSGTFRFSWPESVEKYFEFRRIGS